ncbi:MAG: hypothetical protein PF487_08295 [Bacteroidales bacterium]|jgi:hypothetical protein|nr:hypothetical protein [Bacteroidales bacterium]
MKKIFKVIAYWIGSLLKFLGKFLFGIYTTILVMLTVSIVMGIGTITMIGFFDLITPEMNVLGKIHWDVIAVVIGGATMWLGYSKIMKYEDNY